MKTTDVGCTLDHKRPTWDLIRMALVNLGRWWVSPYNQHFSENARIFEDEIEEMTVNSIRANFTDVGRWSARTVIQLNFPSSYHLLDLFLQRMDLSFRRAHLEKRPAIDTGECVPSHRTGRTSVILLLKYAAALRSFCSQIALFNILGHCRMSGRKV
jgi:hypothetical protein